MVRSNNRLRFYKAGTLSDKLFVPGILGFFAMMFFLGTYLTTLGKEDVRAHMKLALQTEIKDLSAAVAQDGYAWVKVRFEAASPGVVLLCAGNECLWKQHETRRHEVKNEYRDGEWHKVTVLEVDRSVPETVPVKLVAGDAELRIDDWKGIEVCENLLKIDNGVRAEADSSTKKADTSADDKQELDKYLSSGSEGWVFGKFVGGQVGGDSENPFYFSGKDREGFVQESRENEFILTIVQVILATIGSFFAVLFFLFLFRRAKPADLTADPG